MREHAEVRGTVLEHVPRQFLPNDTEDAAHMSLDLRRGLYTQDFTGAHHRTGEVDWLTPRWGGQTSELHRALWGQDQPGRLTSLPARDIPQDNMIFP